MSAAQDLRRRVSASKRLDTVLDSEGKEIRVERREDIEAKNKLDETVDLLLAAGYFRARIKGLSDFDKIVGGMTWCITTCNVDVDVDLLFQENSTIGQKIALTEKIVGTLPRMKCPHRIEPHQIQGLDYIRIFPVVQWLVKKAMQYKSEWGDAVRAFAVSQFRRGFPDDPVELKAKEDRRGAVVAVQRLTDTYRPRRRFRRGAASSPKTDFWRMDEARRVRSTLMEFGCAGTISGASATASTSERAGGSTGDAAEVSPVDWSEEDLLLQAVAGSGGESVLSARAVGHIVGMQSGEIERIVNEYDAGKEKMVEEAKTPEVAFEEKRAALTENLRLLRARKEKLEAKLREAEQDDREVEERLLKAQDAAEPALRKLEELQRLKAAVDPQDAAALESLLSTHEDMKAREGEYKASCKDQLAALQASLSEKRTADNGFDEDADPDVAALKLRVDKERDRLNKAKLALAKKSRELKSLERALDEIPSRAELEQYQKRFLELYDEMAAKHRQTKQFFTLYNTLEDKRRYLEKEVSILESIHDNFGAAMASTAGKEEFLQQLDIIVEGVRKNRGGLERRREEEKRKFDDLSDQLAGLVEKKRLYYKRVKDFQEECDKNDKLLRKS